ncbi:MAG: glycine zipper 2TM domain-containing protein [Polaromonas sp.]
MEINQASNRIHPLIAGAAVSVILVSLMGIAAMTGVLPNSHASAAATTPTTAQVLAVAPAPAPLPPVAVAPAVRAEGVQRKAVVPHHHQVQHAQAQPGQPYPQAASYPQPAPVYRQPAPVAQNSPVGIGVGAVVGGLLGNQIGGGNGKTLATIAGAVGGGYLGNEIAKRNP